MLVTWSCWWHDIVGVWKLVIFRCWWWNFGAYENSATYGGPCLSSGWQLWDVSAQIGPSPISEICHRHILSMTSATNIDEASNGTSDIGFIIILINPSYNPRILVRYSESYFHRWWHPKFLAVTKMENINIFKLSLIFLSLTTWKNEKNSLQYNSTWNSRQKVWDQLDDIDLEI